MNVQVDEQLITLDGQRLRYDPYYVDLAAREKGRNRIDVVRSMLAQWASALANLSSEDQILFLPYSLDDELIECLAAQLKGDQIILRCVEVMAGGCMISLRDFHSFIHASHETWKEYPKALLQCPKEELVAALRSASAGDVEPAAAPADCHE
jgi:hypothetical protein